MANIISVDVEDWFHILELDSTPDIEGWRALESRVERNFHVLLDTFDETDTKATCFFLGWIAERFPHLIKEASARGHEIASHGYAHQLIYTQTRSQFAEDIRRAKKILEDITGESVVGYRAPGFSITVKTPWAFEELSAAGYRYDSSVFPAQRGHGGIVDAPLQPYRIKTGTDPLIEFPISVASIMNRRVCFFGGGYLRLFPYSLIARMTRAVNQEGRPVIYYLHPREIDPLHPRLPMGLVRRFKSYVNLHSTLPKLKRLLEDQRLIPFSAWLTQHSHGLNQQPGP
jgi:polysaccharide deacetylase family protein (PEP-CTERM system associated)